MAHKDLAFAVVHEHPQSFGSRMTATGTIDFEHWVGVSAHCFGQCLVGFKDDIERFPDSFAIPHPYGGYLYYVVVLGVESSGLGVEDDEFLVVVGVDKLLQV